MPIADDGNRAPMHSLFERRRTAILTCTTSAVSAPEQTPVGTATSKLATPAVGMPIRSTRALDLRRSQRPHVVVCDYVAQTPFTGISMRV